MTLQYLQSIYTVGFLGGSEGKESACNVGNLRSIPGLGRSLKKAMATHSSNFAWRIQRIEEPGGRGRKELDTTKHHTHTHSPALGSQVAKNLPAKGET